MASKPGAVLPRDKGEPGCGLSQEAACVWPWWCPVYRWRELVAGTGMEQENLSPRYATASRNGRSAPWREREDRKRHTASGRVPMRGTGADRPVVAMKAL